MKDVNDEMVPPWQRSDESQVSMMWRMGGGEGYLMAWNEWFSQLSKTEQHAYIAKYPEPEDWFGFYQFRFLPPAGFDVLITQYGDDPNNIPDDALTKLWQPQFDLANQVEMWRKRYCELHYQLALLHEEADHIEHAIEHLNKVKTICKHDGPLEEAYGQDARHRFASLMTKLLQLRSLIPPKAM